MENISGNAIIIKEININFVRKVLKDKGQATKQEIAKETGLSFVTVGTALQHLLTQNEIFEAKMAQSSGGRPAQQYSYNYDFAHALALHTYEKEGLHFIHSSVINLNGEIVSELDFQTEVIDVHIWQDVLNCPWSYTWNNETECKMGNQTSILSEEEGICFGCPFEVEE